MPTNVSLLSINAIDMCQKTSYQGE